MEKGGVETRRILFDSFFQIFLGGIQFFFEELYLPRQVFCCRFGMFGIEGTGFVFLERYFNLLVLIFQES